MGEGSGMPLEQLDEDSAASSHAQQEPGDAGHALTEAQSAHGPGAAGQAGDRKPAGQAGDRKPADTLSGFGDLEETPTDATGPVEAGRAVQDTVDRSVVGGFTEEAAAGFPSEFGGAAGSLQNPAPSLGETPSPGGAETRDQDPSAHTAQETPSAATVDGPAGGPAHESAAVPGEPVDPLAMGSSPEADHSANGASRTGGGTRVKQLEREGEVAADFLERLLDIADLDGDIDVDVDGDRAAVAVVDSDEGRVPRRLVGPDGRVLEALQELTRLAVQTATGERSRLMLDVGGFRAERRSALVDVARSAIAEVKESGQQKTLADMTAFERKVVHDEVTAAGLVSESEGIEPHRHIVILPA